MSSVSGKDLARTLERHGWALKRIHGSHHIYGKEVGIVRLSVPIHAKEASRNNLNILHLVFGPSLVAPQSQNPRRSPATPAVLLNRRTQI